jgi:hypothetical protein
MKTNAVSDAYDCQILDTPAASPPPADLFTDDVGEDDSNSLIIRYLTILA